MKLEVTHDSFERSKTFLVKNWQRSKVPTFHVRHDLIINALHDRVTYFIATGTVQIQAMVTHNSAPQIFELLSIHFRIE